MRKTIQNFQIVLTIVTQIIIKTGQKEDKKTFTRKETASWGEVRKHKNRNFLESGLITKNNFPRTPLLTCSVEGHQGLLNKGVHFLHLIQQGQQK